MWRMLLKSATRVNALKAWPSRWAKVVVAGRSAVACTPANIAVGTKVVRIPSQIAWRITAPWQVECHCVEWASA
jgi:hypothetical protein